MSNFVSINTHILLLLLILTETKIANSVRAAEFLPPWYIGEIRKDCVMDGRGGDDACKHDYIIECIDLEANI